MSDETKMITCISCPMGCLMTVTLKDNEVVQVKGNTCVKGVTYAKLETTDPRRIVTTTVRLKNNPELRVLPVKTEKPIPKHLIKECMLSLKDIEVETGRKVGDIILENILDTNINIVATRDA